MDTNKRHRSWGNGHRWLEEPDWNLQRRVHGKDLVLGGIPLAVVHKDWEGSREDLEGQNLVDRP